MKQVSIFICGMMGSGKTTSGKLLADRLKLPFYDLDEHIEQNTGLSIPKIFELKGENEFRRVEREALLSCSLNFNGVMSLGGGALQNQHILDHLKAQGWLIYLQTPLDELFQRLQKSESRPMLVSTESADRFRQVANLLKEREPLYCQAQITIKTKGLNPKQVVQKMIKKLKTHDAIPQR